MDAFAQAAAAVFNDPNMAAAAIYRAGGFAPDIPVRIIRRRPDVDIGFNERRLSSATVMIHVRVAEVANPADGDVFIVGSEHFRVLGAPQRNDRQMIWACEAMVCP
jgi:hypothetical protein